MNNKTVNIDWLIAKIDYELSQSTLSRYITTTGKQIGTDVGYVEDWWNEYKKDLINCLNQTGSVKNGA